MRRIILVFVGAMLLGVLPVAAFAQTEGLGDLKDQVDALEGETPEEWGEAADGVREAFDGLELEAEVEAEVGVLGSAIDDLEAAIEGGDADEIAAAAAAVQAAYGDLETAAAAAGDGTPAPGAVNTGDAVNSGPNTALLVTAGILALLAGGALAIRWSTARR